MWNQRLKITPTFTANVSVAVLCVCLRKTSTSTMNTDNNTLKGSFWTNFNHEVIKRELRYHIWGRYIVSISPTQDTTHHDSSLVFLFLYFLLYISTHNLRILCFLCFTIHFFREKEEMGVDLRQVVAGILTITMFVMLGQMLHRDYYDSLQVSSLPTLFF